MSESPSQRSPELRQYRRPRRVALLLAATVLVLSGCGSSGGSSSGSHGKSSPKLAMQLALTGIPFSTQTAQGGQDGARAAGASITVEGPPTIDPTVSIKQFNDLVATQPDGIVEFPVPAALWVHPFSQATHQGIRIVAIHVPPSPGSDVNMYVGMQEKQAAAELAQLFVQKLGRNARGQIVLGIGPAGEPVNENRILGYKETFAKEMPHVTVIGPFATGSDPIKNLSAWTSIWGAHPNALAFLGTTDQDSGSLAKLKAERGGKVLIGAFDPAIGNGGLAAIARGNMLAGVEQQPYLRGYIAARVLGLAAKAGKPVPTGWVDTGIEVVTQANAAAIVQQQSSLEATRAFYKPLLDKIFANGLAGLPLKPLADVALSPT